MQIKRNAQQAYASFVVHRKVHGRPRGRACMLHGHLPWFKLNLKPIRLTNDSRAKIIVRARRIQPDFVANLRREIPQVTPQFRVGQLARSDSPSYDRDDG